MLNRIGIPPRSVAPTARPGSPLEPASLVLRVVPSAGYSPEILARIGGLLSGKALPRVLPLSEYYRAAEAKLQAFSS